MARRAECPKLVAGTSHAVAGFASTTRSVAGSRRAGHEREMTRTSTTAMSSEISPLDSRGSAMSFRAASSGFVFLASPGQGCRASSYR